MHKCRKTISFGLSIPKDVYNIVEEKRGDISRSKFILGVIEKTYLQQSYHNKTRKIDMAIGQSLNAQANSDDNIRRNNDAVND